MNPDEIQRITGCAWGEEPWAPQPADPAELAALTGLPPRGPEEETGEPGWYLPG